MFIRDEEYVIDNVRYSLHSDLVNGGINEDGEMEVNESFSIAATYENGERFLHYARFVCPGRGQHVVAQARAVALLRRIAAGNPDPKASEFWQVTFPEYGSPAYQDSDAVAWERELDGEPRYGFRASQVGRRVKFVQPIE